MSEPLWQPRSDPAARLLGAGFFAVGAVLLAMQIRSIIDAVAAGTAVSYFHAAFALGEFCLAIGAYWMVRGLAGYHAIRALRERPGAMRTVGIAAFVVIAGTLAGLHLWLQAHGYDS